jgi:hypothetical protein
VISARGCVFALLGDPGSKFQHVVPLALRRAFVFLVEQVDFVVDRFQQVIQHLACRLAGHPRLEAVDEAAEFHQRRQVALADLRCRRSGKHRLEQAHMQGGGHLSKLLQRYYADAALRRSDGANEGGVVIAVGD